MIHRSTFQSVSLAALLMLGASACQPVSAAGGALPAPTVDTLGSAAHSEQVAVLAGGCFWGVEAVFEHVRGVNEVIAGYSGGDADTAHYDEVSAGDTGHAESVQVHYDPALVSYGTLLRVFFSVALDPTEQDRQGPDVGSQYRSVIFYANPEQQRIASAYIAQLGAAKTFPAPIVTKVAPLRAFYPAEAYHQHYFQLHPYNPYIVINDAPKVARLQQLFPALYRLDRQVVEVQLH
ncbi:peptide-methionine (S)-S-oxide reductase [Rhodanobacter thiooxydans]|uniref:Peptide methionine sulfoxide reductase MsrA n=1 Tax=Rhodanobacter thiooxydans TaxID=416169 RepID=A0A154QFT6_9GAMM|nr:peptide-methionine (S)-S-oxide reductase MsrA [Rhodanobacter thiooxydans]EIM02072.1 methionine sulfoxide reductase A [Rhodanobacter thiooxydans LCS2]KZC23159.1 peptide-methionine (S)-S-oxide reductase [Rhodanobacter thiooxydans]MCW0201950.1 peptide-methionine (S)-S-oxide reductase MsrA [Rhodanobacter thiooxydans]